MKSSVKYLIIILVLFFGSLQISNATNDPVCHCNRELSINDISFAPVENQFKNCPDSNAQQSSSFIPEIEPIKVYKTKVISNLENNEDSSSSNDTSIFAFTLELFSQLFEYIF